MDGMNPINNSIADYVNTMSKDTTDVLRDIDMTLRAIAKADGIMISQSSLQDMANTVKGSERNSRTGRVSGQSDNQYSRSNRYDRNASGRGGNGPLFDSNEVRRRGSASAKKFIDDLTEELEGTFVEAITGSRHPFQDAMAKSIKEFADGLGVQVEDLGKEVGKRLGSQVANAFRSNPVGRQFEQGWKSMADNLSNMGQSMLNRYGDILGASGPADIGGLGSAATAAKKGFAEAGKAAAQAATSAESLATGTAVAEAGTTALATQAGTASVGLASASTAATGVATAFPAFGAVLALGSIVLNEFLDCFEPAIKGIKGLFTALKTAGNRIYSQNSKNLELYQARLKADMTTLAKVPFQILEDAANKVMDTWDNVLQTVTATQGYDKAGLQELWSAYAQRLQEEGLDSFVSSADMMENLKRVLDAGLSGDIAEEFAYLATVLNNAIPTQDFFQYADAYASLAANAIKNGSSQESAINTANNALEAFASNLLYAKEQISGGFASSLKNGSELFEQASKIAITSRTGSVEEISAVLTSVSALVGSVAPDLASGIVDAVVKAATGGNSNEITALRSMTSVGASNTAFLKALAKNPQRVFSELFSNLANLQNMSADNYMEVAEALSSVFGISMDAFARVDFQYLADAISKMNLYSGYVYDSLEQLKSGETTLTASQLRMQEVNKYMIEEGLSYVLDNEVGRAIQEHMWEEQLAREIEANTYAVDLQGAALEALNGIWETLDKVHKVMAMMGGATGLGNSIASGIQLTVLESGTLAQDIKNILEEQKVGAGNAREFYTLTNGNEDLNLIASYPELIGIGSITETLRGTFSSASLWNDIIAGAAGVAGGVAGLTPMVTGQAIAAAAQEQAQQQAQEEARKAASSNNNILSSSAKGNLGNLYYNWGARSKSTGLVTSGDWRTNASYSAIWHSQEALEQSNQQNVQNFLDTMGDYVGTMVKSLSTEGSSSKAIAGAREESEFKYLSQSELENLVLTTPMEEGSHSFNEWVQTAFDDYHIANLGQTLSDFGLTMVDVESAFNEATDIAQAKTERARQMHEVQFWENVEEYNNNYFPNHFENEFLRVDWMENWEVNYLTPIRDDLHQFLEDWEDYYIHHTAYTQATSDAFENAIQLADLEKDEMGDSVLALAKALTENNNWLQENQEVLKDPVVHANVLLSQILLVTESIMQQNNSVSTGSAIPTTLLGLSTGGISSGGTYGTGSSYY